MLQPYPLVSVLVPVYRHEQYIRACLDSIVASTYPALELIIVNDASPDDSDGAIRAWLLAHPTVEVQYSVHQQNLGVTKTLNELIKAAKGDFICLIAGDDLLLPTGIAQRVAYLQAHPHKLAVFADCHVIDEQGEQIYESGIEGLHQKQGLRKRFLAIDQLITLSIIFHWAVPGPVLLCRKETYALVGLYDEQLLVEDRDMYLRIAARNGLGFLDTYVACYRIQQNSMIRTVRQEALNAVALSVWKNIALFRGIARWRLVALYIGWDYNRSSDSLRRSLLIGLLRGFLVISLVPYRMLRSMLALWVRVQGGPEAPPRH